MGCGIGQLFCPIARKSQDFLRIWVHNEGGDGDFFAQGSFRRLTEYDFHITLLWRQNGAGHDLNKMIVSFSMVKPRRKKDLFSVCTLVAARIIPYYRAMFQTRMRNTGEP
jgi:hypothetical protein